MLKEHRLNYGSRSPALEFLKFTSILINKDSRTAFLQIDELECPYTPELLIKPELGEIMFK